MAGRWGGVRGGALAALHDALPTLDFTRLHAYVGVSAGAFVTAGLRQRHHAARDGAAFIENEGEDGDALSPSVFMRLRCASTPPRVANLPGARDGGGVGQRQARCGHRACPSCSVWLRVIPTGLFDNRPIERACASCCRKPGRSNDFRELPALFVIATDLDSGETVEFGSP